MDLSGSLLHTVEWGRIVLDEAHKIKARTTNTAKCIYALRSTFKWCLTGRGLHSFPFRLNLSSLCPFPLNLSLLCPPYNPN